MPKPPGNVDDAGLPADADDTFLRRWSRRKAADNAALKPADSMVATSAPADVGDEALPHLTDADMPPLETLTSVDDFSPFMAPGVSDRLRNLALRKLFGAPGFNIRDGLDDYDDDYTRFDTIAKATAAELKARLHGDGGTRADSEPPGADGVMSPAVAEPVDNTAELDGGQASSESVDSAPNPQGQRQT